jgi:hypothetical protein
MDTVQFNNDNQLENEFKSLTIDEFKEMWDRAKRIRAYYAKLNAYNIVLEITGTEIRADDYTCYSLGPYTLIVLYYKKDIVATIELKYIKKVY